MTPDAARQVLNNGAFEFPVQLRSIIAISMGDGLVAAEGSRHEVGCIADLTLRDIPH